MSSIEEVKAVGSLARLALEGDELAGLAKDFNNILAFVAELSDVDTSGVEPMTHVHSSVNIWRADETEPSMASEQVFLNAPSERDCFVSPLAIEKPKG
jgi:aspartyl-tRNA(Asn)/glutamyl-tRNA(Gln) amidotransferase subunit C